MRHPLRLYLFALILVLGINLRASAEGSERWNVIAIDYPHATATEALDINPAGEIVGRYVSATDQNTHGFLRNDVGEFTTIDFPGAIFTVAAGINPRGDIVGWYRLPTDPQSNRHGFLLSQGSFTTIDPPGALFTNVLGINSRGDIVGRFCTTVVVPCMFDTGNVHGFMLAGGAFTAIDFPGAIRTNVWGINPRGQIVGGYTGADGQNHLFLLGDGEFTRIELPPTWSISLGGGGINSRGDIVSFYCDTAPCTITSAHGFLLSNNEFTSIDLFGAAATGASGISADGDIVGEYIDVSGSEHGFLLSQE
jgi:uncharacterized membrane protein